MFAEILISSVVILFVLFFYLRNHYEYWKRKGIPHYGPSKVLEVLLDQVLGRKDMGTIFQEMYVQHKANGYFGFWNMIQPTLVVTDLDLCKQILTKDFNHFVSREMGLLTHEYISRHLFSLEGQEWREMRMKLTPTFTSGKMKNMFVLMEKCAEQLQDHIEQVVLKQGEFEVKDLCSRLTSDIIATCAFGLDLNSIRDGESEFATVGKLLIRPSSLLLAIVKYLFLKYFPNFGRILNVTSIDPRFTSLFTNLVKDTVEYRTKNNVNRNDFIDLMMRVNQEKISEDDVLSSHGGSECENKLKFKDKEFGHRRRDHLTIEEMTAQASLFFIAGFETAASTTSFCLYELSKNRQVQSRLRREIDEVLTRHEGQITYQALQDMTYMDQVMNETLRMYASLPLLTRVCTEPYRLPGSDLVIDKGVRVNIPTYVIHHDPEIYPDPFTFHPERFSEQNSKDRHQYAFLPFGEGPRNCIGMRFGRMQVKIALAAILSRYELTPAPGTPSWLELDPFTIFTNPKHPFSLRIVKRTDL